MENSSAYARERISLMEIEIINLSEEDEDEIDTFDLSIILNSYEWLIRDEIYKLADIVCNSDNNGKFCNWDTIVRRVSDDKYFKINVGKKGGGYDFYLYEVFPENGISKIYK